MADAPLRLRSGQANCGAEVKSAIPVGMKKQEKSGNGKPQEHSPFGVTQGKKE
jgi:hypothetical protein